MRFAPYQHRKANHFVKGGIEYRRLFILLVIESSVSPRRSMQFDNTIVKPKLLPLKVTVLFLICSQVS
jgi:hypothetical protein